MEKKSKKYLSTDEKKELVTIWDELTYDELAHKFEVNRNTIIKWGETFNSLNKEKCIKKPIRKRNRVDGAKDILKEMGLL